MFKTLSQGQLCNFSKLQGSIRQKWNPSTNSSPPSKLWGLNSNFLPSPPPDSPETSPEAFSGPEHAQNVQITPRHLQQFISTINFIKHVQKRPKFQENRRRCRWVSNSGTAWTRIHHTIKPHKHTPRLPFYLFPYSSTAQT